MNILRESIKYLSLQINGNISAGYPLLNTKNMVNVRKILTIILIALMISSLFYLLIINLNIIIPDTTLFNDFYLQTEFYSMGIENGPENHGVPSIKCPKCLKDDVEV